jgi:hypothetical protein
MKKGRDKIWDFFDNQKPVFYIGPLCFVYFLLMQIPGHNIVTPILPPIGLEAFGIFAALVFLIQILAWRKLKLFDAKFKSDFVSWGMFLCEYGVLLFAVLFLSWPLYGIWLYFADPTNKGF